MRVKCIDDTINPDFIIETVKYFKNWVKKDVIYTVYDVLENDGIVEAFLLEELQNEMVYQPLLGREQEPAFKISRFEIISYEEEEEEEEYFEYNFFLN
jgi:hypothetical protein